MKRINLTFLLCVVLLASIACSLTPIVRGTIERTKDDTYIAAEMSTIVNTATVPHMTATPRQWIGETKRIGEP